MVYPSSPTATLTPTKATHPSPVHKVHNRAHMPNRQEKKATRAGLGRRARASRRRRCSRLQRRDKHPHPDRAARRRTRPRGVGRGREELAEPLPQPLA